jgi:hypothetical protein
MVEEVKEKAEIEAGIYVHIVFYPHFAMMRIPAAHYATSVLRARTMMRSH